MRFDIPFAKKNYDKALNMRIHLYKIILAAGLFCAILVLHTPLQAARQTTASLADDHEEQQFRNDLAVLQQLVEEALAWRLEARDMYTVFEAKIDAGLPLSHEEIELIHSGSNYYLAMREKLLVYAHKYEKYVAGTNRVRCTPGKGTRVAVEEEPGIDYQASYTRYRVDPEDDRGRLILDRIKLSLAASLVLYDNYLIAIYPYQENSKLRNLINFDNIKVSRKLDAVTLNYLRLEYRAMVKKALRFYDQYAQWLQKNRTSGKFREDYLDILITGSLSYETLQEKSILGTAVRLGGTMSRIFQDNVNQFSRESINILSGLVGNTLGLVETRKGKMKNLTNRELRALEHQLQPLDILLEKTPFRLTDKFIPGYYGHVAIWVGGPADWQREGLDITGDPVVRKNLKKISSGRKVVEALRPGVELNSLEHFLNIDDLVILRHKNLAKETKEEYLIRALAQVGKKYDFNFDVETDSKIVCSELAYVVFHDVDWQTEKSIGRYTISPDNVAHMALGKGPFAVVELYHDGRLIQQDQEHYFAALLQDGE